MTLEKLLEVKNRTDRINVDVTQIDPTLDDIIELLGNEPVEKEIPFMLWLSDVLSTGENEGYYDDIVEFLQKSIQRCIEAPKN